MNEPKLTRYDINQFLATITTVYVGDKQISPAQVAQYITDLETNLVKLATVVAEKV